MCVLILLPPVGNVYSQYHAILSWDSQCYQIKSVQVKFNFIIQVANDFGQNANILTYKWHSTTAY